MKEVKLFVLEGCPHCRRAREWMRELFARHPEYAKVPLTIIDEEQSPGTAGAHDYYFVPTFYVGGEKRMEGVPSQEAIARVFAEAAGAGS